MDMAYIINKNLNTDITNNFLSSAEPFYKTKDSLANSDVSIIIPSRLNKTHYVSYIHVVLSGANASANCNITIKDGSYVRFKTVIPNGAVVGVDKTVSFVYPIATTTSNSLEIKATGSGAGSIITLNVGGYTL